MKLKRQINSFLTILGLDRVAIDLEALNKKLAPFDSEYWAQVGALTTKEKRLFAVAHWCGNTGDRLVNESGQVEYCCDDETRKLLEYLCEMKGDNVVKITWLNVMCTTYLNYLIHERLNIHSSTPLTIFHDFAVCYYMPVENQPEPRQTWIPEFVKN